MKSSWDLANDSHFIASTIMPFMEQAQELLEISNLSVETHFSIHNQHFNNKPVNKSPEIRKFIFSLLKNFRHTLFLYSYENKACNNADLKNLYYMIA